MTVAPGDRGSSTQNVTWSEPQRHWLPISRAVFRFAITHTEGHQSAETHQDDQNPFSIESFEKFKSRRDSTSADVVDGDTNPLSLHNLGRTLRERAGVRQAEIDLDSSYFTFSYEPPTGGSAVMALIPWHQAPRLDPVKIEELEREALFNKGNGLVLISGEEAKQGAQQYKAARAATNFVWNQLMLPAFDGLVSSGRVKVYARVVSRLAQFQQLPPDLWSRLKVLEWDDGAARDPEGNGYFSIHAAEVSPPQAEASPEAAKDTVLNKMPATSKRRIAEREIEPTFERWRAQQAAGHVPTAAQDVAYMKTHGISRKRTRALIKKFGGRARGDKPE